jgi:CRP-like cAMP-binding protein
MAQEEIRRFIRRLQLQSNLTSKSIDALRALPWRLMKRSKQSYVVREGDIPKEVSVLVTGFAQRQKHTADGTRQIVSFSIPGDPLDFDCLFLNESDFSVQMSTDGMIACVRTDALHALMENQPDLARALTTTLLADAAVFAEWVLNTGRRDARQRLAHLLCEILVRARAQDLETDPFELPYTQEQLADATGLTPVHVNRVLRQLATQGAICRTGRFIQVPNWNGLSDIAGFDERFLHMHRLGSSTERLVS